MRATERDELRRSIWQRIVDAFFGYDFFISYAHADGGTYARGLAQRLKQRGFECFLDTENYARGDDWKRVGAWALRRTSRLVLVATPRALTSEPVRREVEIFTGAAKRVIPIAFGGSLASGAKPDNPLLAMIGDAVLRIEEPTERMGGGPSDGVVKEIVATFQHTRQSVKRRNWLQGFAAVLTVLLATATWQAVRATRQERIADERARIALSRQLSAQSIAHLDDQLDLALLLALEAGRIADTVEAKSALLTALEYRPRLAAFLTGHGDRVVHLAFSPDGKTLASSSWDKTVVLWDVATRRPVGTPLAHDQAVYGAEFHPAGSMLASSDGSGRVVLWDLASRRPVAEPAASSATEVSGLAFDPSGDVLAWGTEPSGSDRPMITLWSVPARKALRPAWPGHVLAFSPDRRSIATGGPDGDSILLRNVATGRPIASLKGFDGRLRSLAFDPEGKILASGSDDGRVTLWDVDARQPVAAPLAAHAAPVNCLAFSPDGRTLASGSGDKSVVLWSLETGKPLGLPLLGATDPVFGLAFSPDGRTLASTSGDKRVILWNPAEEHPLARRLEGVESRGPGLAFSPDGKTLAFPGEFSRVVLWDVAAGRIAGAPLEGHERAVSALAFSPDGKLLASGGLDKTILLWDLASVKPIGPALPGHRSPVWSLAFSPDGRTLASGGDAALILWDVASRAALGGPLGDQKDRLWGLAFSPDGRTLASIGGSTGGVFFWDVASRTHVGSIMPTVAEFGLAPASVVFGPDGRMLASTSGGRDVALWDTGTRAPLGPPLAGHKYPVRALALSPDGALLASGAQDGAIILWDVAARQPIGRPLVAHTGEIEGLAFSPDGRTLASSGGDHAVYLWDVDHESWRARARRIANRDMTREEWSRHLGDEPYREGGPESR